MTAILTNGGRKNNRFCQHISYPDGFDNYFIEIFAKSIAIAYISVKLFDPIVVDLSAFVLVLLSNKAKVAETDVAAKNS